MQIDIRTSFFEAETEKGKRFRDWIEVYFIKNYKIWQKYKLFNIETTEGKLFSFEGAINWEKQEHIRIEEKESLSFAVESSSNKIK